MGNAKSIAKQTRLEKRKAHATQTAIAAAHGSVKQSTVTKPRKDWDNETLKRKLVDPTGADESLG